MLVSSASDIKQALAQIANPEDAVHLARYFKTGPGGYGEGDRFIGVRVPDIRRVTKARTDLTHADLDVLLDSDIHEHRLAALTILVAQFDRASRPRTINEETRTELSDFYLAAVLRGRVNNWDLVDSSAEFILGEYLFEKPRGILFELAASPVIWERRVAVLSSFAFIKRRDASTTVELARHLLNDREDLIQKAVGWMLREIGKRVDRDILLAFLDQNAPRMPRTMLSYATEHLDPVVRAAYRAAR